MQVLLKISRSLSNQGYDLHSHSSTVLESDQTSFYMTAEADLQDAVFLIDGEVHDGGLQRPTT